MWQGRDRTRIVLSLLLLSLLAGCGEREAVRKVRLATANGGQAGQATQERKVPIRIAVAPVISPRESFKLYPALLEYISRRIGRPVDFIQRRTYQEINELVRYGHADAAFVCDLAYVEGERDFGMQMLVAPVVMGKSRYQSYIIVPRASDAKSLFDLRGRTFAFSDPLSSSGWLFPTYLLKLEGEKPETFFRRSVFTYGHDNTVKAVAERQVDGGAVDSLVYEYLIARDPQFGEKTRVIQISQLWGNPPVVVHPRIDPAIRQSLKQAFLTAHEDEEGRRVLAPLLIDRFLAPDDRDYDNVREMATVIRNR